MPINRFAGMLGFVCELVVMACAGLSDVLKGVPPPKGGGVGVRGRQ